MRKKRKLSAYEALANVNALPKSVQSSGPRRESFVEFQRQYDAEIAAQEKEIERIAGKMTRRQFAQAKREIAERILREADTRQTSVQYHKYCQRITDWSTFEPESLRSLIQAGFENFCYSEFDMPTGRFPSPVRPTQPEHEMLAKYIVLNNLSPLDESSFKIAWTILRADGLVRNSLAFAVEPDPVEPALEIKEVASEPVLIGAEKDHAEHAQLHREWISEVSPVFHEAVDSIQRSSGLVMQEAEQRTLIDKFVEMQRSQRRPVPWSLGALRYAAYLLWQEKIGLTPEEYAAWVEGGEDDKLSADAFAKKVGRINGYRGTTGLAATRNVREG
jgi:hypothetical protein